jgi:uncharacterized protein (TIGR00288 family)
MLLIDADNVSVDVMEQAVRLLLLQHGGLHVRRAYCTAESAVANQAAFKRLGIKPMVNLAAGKNSTDIAMAVDAIDLVLAERPDVVVIASSDSDFAPLVHRLREKGCVVRGIGQLGKTGDETQDVYDDFTVLEHRKGAVGAEARQAPARKTTRSRAGGKPAAEKAPAQKKAPGAKKAAAKPAAKSAAAKTPARKSATRKRASSAEDIADAAAASSAAPPAAEMAATAAAPAPARAPVPASTPAPSAPSEASAPLAPAVEPGTGGRGGRGGRGGSANAQTGGSGGSQAANRGGATVQAILACLPELAEGQGLALNVAVQRLREAHLLGKNSSSLKLFAQWSERFDLLPADKPTQVRLRR